MNLDVCQNGIAGRAGGGSREVGWWERKEGGKKWLNESRNSAWWLRMGEKTAACHVRGRKGVNKKAANKPNQFLIFNR